jgi:hypothetical protein
MSLMLTRSFAFGAALLCALPTAAAADYAVIGDSLGVGVNWAAKSRYPLARNSIAIHGPQILDQIRQVPPGTLTFMSLGTNDAVGGAVDIKRPLRDILAAVNERKIKLVWLGPPCVRKPWNAYSRELDAELQRELKDTGVTYVSMFFSQLCDNPSLRGREGVHFNMAGYRLMWEQAAEAVGVPVITLAANETPTSVREHHRRRPSPKRHRRRRPPLAIAPLVAPAAAPEAK